MTLNDTDSLTCWEGAWLSCWEKLSSCECPMCSRELLLLLWFRHIYRIIQHPFSFARRFFVHNHDLTFLLFYTSYFTKQHHQPPSKGLLSSRFVISLQGVLTNQGTAHFPFQSCLEQRQSGLSRIHAATSSHQLLLKTQEFQNKTHNIERVAKISEDVLCDIILL